MTEIQATYDTGTKDDRKNQDLQQMMLRQFLGQMVTVHLVNGIRLTGKLVGHDRFILQLHTGQMVYKHAITTVSPGAERYSNREHGKGERT